MTRHPDLSGICPLCGKANHCALSDNPNASDCWCRSKKFPDTVVKKSASAPRSLARSTADDASFDKRCICLSCLRKLQQGQQQQ